ncbi:hypothetical protein KGF56_002016 [Candida oxycetoniae]|uniref:BRCT domain-containing protein n=1 Tax=Candida oxycetoniae TaxID=497107 RepID=A0AAI9SYE3_9ASCO|nr:uncharacterized protein KGF56_002016 [Candida oxycetoniae]KAI3405178.2 hypothetical protein KGF56_002016 [Candida oxycetoniae]
MWVARHEAEVGLDCETKILIPEHIYKVGRKEDVDFRFTSRKSSRELLDVIIGSAADASGKIPLHLCILSRAKSKINEEVVRLQKDEKPKKLDFTQSLRIVIQPEADSNPDYKDYPLVIEWVDFKLYVDTKDELIDKLAELNIGISVVTDINEATHVYTNKTSSNSIAFKKAVIKGLHILSESWLKTLLSNPNNVDAWLEHHNCDTILKIDNDSLSRKSRVHFLQTHLFLSFYKIEWMDTEIVEKSEEEIKTRAGDNKFVLINSHDVFGLNALNEDDLFQQILSNSLDSIPVNHIPQLKRSAASAIGQRKRRKYEKVDKLHFFSLNNIPSSSNITKEPPGTSADKDKSQTHQDEPEPLANLELEGQFTKETQLEPQDLPEVNLISSINKAQEEEKGEAEIEEEIEEEDDDDEKEEAVDNKVSNNETSQEGEGISPVKQPVGINLRKRKYESFTSQQPPKIAKFIPKISFIDAVVQAKEESTKSWNKELGIAEKQGEEISQDLSNLAIVEIVDTPLRRKQYPNVAMDISCGERKNFKKFKKNKPFKLGVGKRPYIEMVNADTLCFPGSKQKKKDRRTVDSEFNGAISEVKGYRPSVLFVEDDDSETEAMSIFQSMKSQEIVNDSSSSTLQFKNNEQHKANGADKRMQYYQDDAEKEENEDEDEDEEEDDDYGQPRFGFSR